MTSKPPTNPQPKPQIFPGDPKGIPMPTSLDRLEAANQALADLSRGHNEMAARHSASHVAEKAQQRVQAYRRAGFPELDEIPELTGDKYRNQAIYETSDGRSWLLIDGRSLTGSAEGPIGRHPEYVTYADFELEGIKFVDALQWNQVTVTELASMRDQAEKDEADTAEIEAARAMAKSIISKAKRHPYTEHPPIKTGWDDVSLDDVDRVMAATGAKIVVVGSGTLLVSAARQDELIAAIPKDAPKFTRKQLAGYTNQVYELMHYLEVLGPLAVSWARTGKRPPSDVDAKQLANRVTAGGAFVH